jgi:hypothetical protein
VRDRHTDGNTDIHKHGNTKPNPECFANPYTKLYPDKYSYMDSDQ